MIQDFYPDWLQRPWELRDPIDVYNDLEELWWVAALPVLDGASNCVAQGIAAITKAYAENGLSVLATWLLIEIPELWTLAEIVEDLVAASPDPDLPGSWVKALEELAKDHYAHVHDPLEGR